jgi:uncharacterized protein involved in type VI secretion and phage assembly
MDEKLAGYFERTESKCWGKYRALVVDRNDPDQLGRLKLSVPSVFGDAVTGWAWPVSPYAGAGVGFFFIPQVGDVVWVEFVEGELEHPIWSGGMWAKPEKESEIPAEAKESYPDTALIKMKSGTLVMLSDADGRVTVRAKNGCEIVLDATTNVVTIQASEVQIRGEGGVVQELVTKAFVDQVFSVHTHVVDGTKTLKPVSLPPLPLALTSVLKAG